MTSRAEREIARTIAGLKKETRSLARASQAARRSVEIADGPVSYYDEDGVERLRVGPEDDGAFTVQEVNGPTPPQPTEPDVDTVAGGVVIKYDGTYEDADLPSDFSHTEVHVSDTPGYVADDSTQIATFPSSLGGEYFYALPEAAGPRYFSLVTVTRSLQESEKSIEVEGVGGAEVVTTDGLAPADSPALTLVPLYSTFMARWPASTNPDFTGYTVWLDAPDIAAGPVAGLHGTSTQIVAEPDGSPLRRNIDYTAWVVAFDADGDGPAGVSDTAQLAALLPEDIDQQIIDSIAQAQNDATSAQAAAASASDAAAAANAEALAAAGLAGSKGKVIIQSAAPAAADQLAQNLWIDTTGGSNTPKRWDGDSWEPVTDKAATDAAAAAAAAQAAADAAGAAAADAAVAAGNAQATANGKNTVWYQAAAPAGSSHSVDDVWYDTDDGYKPHQWDGDSWEPRPWGHQSIATMDAGKITVGFLAAARIAANTINALHLTIGTLSEGAASNGSFEDDLVGWTVWGQVNGTTAIDATVSSSGGKSVKITKSNTTGAVGLRMDSACMIPLASGEWSITARAKASAAVNTAYTIQILWYDASRTFMSTTGLTPSTNFPDTEFLDIERTLPTPPAGARYFVFDSYVPAAVPIGTSIWVDEIQVRELVDAVRIRDGAVSAVKVGADVIVANEAYAKTGYIGSLKADQIESGLLDATIGILQTLEVGSNITIDPTNGIVIRLTEGEIHFPADGSPAVVTAGINAKWLTIEDNLSIRGSGVIQGELNMANGIVRPVVAPEASVKNRSVVSAALTDAEGNGSDLYFGMIEWSSTQYMVAVNFFGAGLRYVNKDATYSWGFDAVVAGTGWGDENAYISGLCKVGSDIYVLIQDNGRPTSGTFYGKWYIYRIDGTTFNKTSEVFVGDYNTFGGADASAKGVLCEMGGAVAMIWQKSDKALTIRRYHPTTFAQIGTDRTLFTPATRTITRDAHYGPHGPAAANRLYVGREATSNIHVFSPSVTPNLSNDPTWTRQNSEEFPKAAGSSLRGLVWDNRVKTGSIGNANIGERFQSLTPNGRIYDYGRNITSETVRLAYAWYDGNTTSGSTTHRTEESPEYAYSRPARTAIYMETPAAPDINNNDAANLDKANQIILYGAVGETPKLQDTLAIGVRSQVFWDTLSHAGAAPSASNEFATAGVTPGVLQSTFEDSRGRLIELSGAGSGRVGPLEWNPSADLTRDSGNVSASGGTFTGSVRAIRIGQIVFVTGGINRATGFQTGFTSVGAVLPADYRPSANRFGPGCIGHNSASTYQFRIDSDGTVNVRQSGAITVDMQCNFFFFI